MSNSDPDFADDYDTDPPVPVEAAGQVANGCDDKTAIPDDLFPEEHTAQIGDKWVLRSGWNCPQCGSEIFLHPRSVVPHNCVYCFNCSYAPFGVVWWEDARLGDIVPEEG